MDYNNEHPCILAKAWGKVGLYTGESKLIMAYDLWLGQSSAETRENESIWHPMQASLSFSNYNSFMF